MLRHKLEEHNLVIVLLIMILLLAAFMRFMGLTSQNLGPDEIKMAETVRPDRDIQEVMYIPLVDTPTPKPPLTYLINHLFLNIADTDFTLRFPSVLFGIAGVAVTYAMGKVLADKWLGLLCAFLLSISVAHIRYSQVARFYPALLFLSLLSLYSLYRAISRGERNWWFALTLANALNLYNHYSAFFVLASESAIVGIFWLWKIALARRRYVASACISSVSAKRSIVIGPMREILLPFVLSLLVSFVAYLPMMPHLVTSAGARADWGLTPTASFAKDVIVEWVPESGFSPWLFGLFVLVGLLAFLRQGRPQLLVIALWLGVPFLALFTLPLIHKFYTRYFAFMLPLFLVLSSRGIMGVSEILSRIAARPFGKPRLSWLGTAGLLLLITVPTGLTLRKYYARTQSDWRAAAHFLCDTVAPDDVVVIRRASHQAVLRRYCDSITDQSFALVGRPDAELLRDLLHRGGVWIVGKETQTEAMSESERELRVAADWPVLRVIFKGSVATGLPGVGQRLLDDIWVLYTREGLTEESIVDLYHTASPTLPSDADVSILYPERGQ